MPNQGFDVALLLTLWKVGEIGLKMGGWLGDLIAQLVRHRESNKPNRKAR